MTKARRRRLDIPKLLAPVAAAIDPDPQLTRGNALIRKKWSDGRGHGLSSEEAGELHAIKGWRVPDQHVASRRWDLEKKSLAPRMKRRSWQGCQRSVRCRSMMIQ